MPPKTGAKYAEKPTCGLETDARPNLHGRLLCTATPPLAVAQSPCRGDLPSRVATRLHACSVDKGAKNRDIVASWAHFLSRHGFDAEARRGVEGYAMCCAVMLSETSAESKPGCVVVSASSPVLRCCGL